MKKMILSLAIISTLTQAYANCLPAYQDQLNKVTEQYEEFLSKYQRAENVATGLSIGVLSSSAVAMAGFPGDLAMLVVSGPIAGATVGGINRLILPDGKEEMQNQILDLKRSITLLKEAEIGQGLTLDSLMPKMGNKVTSSDLADTIQTLNDHNSFCQGETLDSFNTIANKAFELLKL